MAPIHALRLASRRKTDGAAQAATFEFVGRAGHQFYPPTTWRSELAAFKQLYILQRSIGAYGIRILETSSELGPRRPCGTRRNRGRSARKLRAGRKTQPAAIQVPPALAYVLPVPAHTADKPTCFATSASIPAASFWYCFLLIAARPVLVQEAFRLEYVTLAWMLVEAVVSIGSGVAARSTTLLAAGIDSLIELASAALLIWRLTLELQRGEASAEDAERKASRVGGALLFALAAYVVIAAAWSLWTREGQEFSWPGLMVSLVSLPIMWVLRRRKLRLADAR